jgi:Ran GTPase-activating protein (RanGAP) involved in mRNA processing and transport
MKELNLSGNNITDEGAEVVVSSLSKCLNEKKKSTNLVNLGLSNNGLTSSGCSMVCDFIKKCPYMEELQLSNNEIDNVGANNLI